MSLSTRIAAAALACSGLVGTPCARADRPDHPDSALTAFLSVEHLQRDAAPTSDLERSTTVATVDVILGVRHDRLRALAELVLASDEHELERLQLGYQATEDLVLWVGRFHQPASVWNALHHHGAYLQTSISRPWIEEWEDEHGVMPQHVTGALGEWQHSLASGTGLRLSLGFGSAPTLRDDGLDPYDHFGGRRIASSAHGAVRLEWLPDAAGEDSVGLVASHGELVVQRADALFGAGIEHGVYGLFFNATRARAHVIGTFYGIELHGPGTATLGRQHHLASYLQFEFAASERLTLYARHEQITGLRQSAYLREFPRTMPRRILAGARLELGRRNAVSVEVARRATLSAGSFGELRLQWSAAIP
ncbi:MAG: hypothetical protein U1F30_07355 [Steroidobacteraceae bacterium]